MHSYKSNRGGASRKHDMHDLERQDTQPGANKECMQEWERYMDSKEEKGESYHWGPSYKELLLISPDVSSISLGKQCLPCTQFESRDTIKSFKMDLS